MATTATLTSGIVLNDLGVTPVRAGDIRYTVQVLDIGAVLTDVVARHVVDDNTKIVPAKPGDPVLIWCYGTQCLVFAMTETIEFLQCPEVP